MRRLFMKPAGGPTGIPHKFWRILATQDSFVAVSGNFKYNTFFTISLFSSTGATGTDLCLAATAFASTEFSLDFSASDANDNNPSTRWASRIDQSVFQWWAVDLPVAQEVHSVSFLPYPTAYHAQGYNLQYSDDGVVWLTQSSFSPTASPSLQTFNNL